MNSWRFTSQALRQDFCRAHAAFFLSGAVPLLSTVMLLAIIITTTSTREREIFSNTKQL